MGRAVLNTNVQNKRCVVLISGVSCFTDVPRKERKYQLCAVCEVRKYVSSLYTAWVPYVLVGTVSGPCRGRVFPLAVTNWPCGCVATVLSFMMCASSD